MPLFSIGDLAQSLLLRQNVGLAKSRVAVLSQEMSSGVKLDLAAHLRGTSGTLTAMNGALRQVEGFHAATTELGLRADTMQAALDAMSETASRLAVPLQAAQSPSTVAFAVMTRDALAGFETVVGALNVQVAGQALFSGKVSDQLPLPDAAQFLAELQGVAAGEITMAGLRDKVDAWFDDPAGFAALYRGGDPTAPIAVSAAEEVALSATALDPAIRDSLKGFALAALAQEGMSGLDATGRQALAVEAGRRLATTEQGRADLRAGLGLAQARIEAATTRNSAERMSLEMACATMIEADPYTTATDLSAAQTRLETIYAITSRMAGLSLVNYLR